LSEYIGSSAYLSFSSFFLLERDKTFGNRFSLFHQPLVTQDSSKKRFDFLKNVHSTLIKMSKRFNSSLIFLADTEKNLP